MSGFIIIPDSIMDDKNLKLQEKILLGMIMRLSQKGECFASNEFFAKKLNIHHVNISKYIKGLEQKKYVEIEYEFSGAKIKNRKIRLAKTLMAVSKNTNGTISENAKDNNTYINKQFNIYKPKKSFKNYSEDNLQDDLEYINKIYEKYGGLNA